MGLGVHDIFRHTHMLNVDGCWTLKQISTRPWWSSSVCSATLWPAASPSLWLTYRQGGGNADGETSTGPLRYRPGPLHIKCHKHGHIWVCLKMLCTPLYPMVTVMIIIPMKNGYFIGNINPTFSDKPIWTHNDSQLSPWGLQGQSDQLWQSKPSKPKLGLTGLDVSWVRKHDQSQIKCWGSWMFISPVDTEYPWNIYIYIFNSI